jgi:ADP-ribose pyrophosphatase YjhB (NUDIX family)
MTQNPIIKVKALCIISRNGNEILAGAGGRDDVKNESFGRLIGGGVEFGETSEIAVRREFKEELNAELENLKLFDVVENIFTFNGEQGHQVMFVYTGEFVDKSLYQKERIKIIDAHNDAVWYPIEDLILGKSKIYPVMDYEKIIKLKN